MKDSEMRVGYNKGMGLFSRFTNASTRQLFHSSGVVGDTDGQTLGTTNTESFEQRQQVERSRRLVGGYRDAGVLHNYRKEAHDDLASQQDDAKKDRKHHHEERSTSQLRSIPSSRIDIVKSSRITRGSDAGSSPVAGKPSPASRPSFQEPSSRRFNPYQ